MAILELKDVTKKFGGLTANEDITIHANEGEILGIIGANGAGKTTLFNMLSGALPVTSGKIIFNGEEIQNKKASQVCKLGIGRTYQLVQPFTNMTVLANVMVGAFVRYPKKEDAQRKAEEVLKFTGLYDIKDVRGNNLTLTQMKRMEVAKALATEPKLIICDEPVSALDVSVRAQILNLLMDLKKDLGLAMVFISHDIQTVRYISDRIVVMNGGKPVEEGTAEQVFNNPRDEYTKLLLGAAPSLLYPDLGK